MITECKKEVHNDHGPHTISPGLDLSTPAASPPGIHMKQQPAQHIVHGAGCCLIKFAVSSNRGGCSRDINILVPETGNDKMGSPLGTALPSENDPM